MRDFLGKLLSRKPEAVWLALLLVAFALGYWLRGEGKQHVGHAPATAEALQRATHEYATAEMPENSPCGHTTPHQAKSGDDTLYVCPMMCVPPMDKPGNCPVCGMELTRVAAGHGHADINQPRLRLSPEAVRLAEIEVIPVERKFVSAEVRLFGEIDYDPAHMSYITSFMPGVIDRVYVKRAGQFVRWGDPLFDVYSSDLLATQQQLMEAVRHVPGFYSFQSGAPHVAREALIQPLQRAKGRDEKSPEAQKALKTINAIRHKLAILGMPKRDIDELMKLSEPTGIATVYAPMYGQVIEQKAFEGTYVNTGTPIFTIGDPHYVWARLDAYEADYPWIRKRQEVFFQVDAYPGETFKGRVVYIDPVFNAKTRTFNVGVILPDHGGRMKPGMLVRATVHARLTEDGKVAYEETQKELAPLVIPASAPLITGKRAVVYVAVPGEEGRFEGREVTLGPKARHYYVVLGGLKEGERVVTNGNFKIDSAIQILAKSSFMDIEGGHSATAHHQHGGSEGMDEHYQSERRKSRSRAWLDSEHPKHDMHLRTERRGISRSATRPRGQSTIHRRKPGMYGDTTRPTPRSWGR